ncbi:MAG: transcription termination/antitermination NusG family protein [Ginsengibacter sp.]
MQNNWYAVYTKPHCERKVNSLLSKRNIESYCPLNSRKYRQLFRSTTSSEPLFKSYVFVKTTEVEIQKLIKEISGVISLLYWKGKPATIKEEEINAIMDFSRYHQEIAVEKIHLKSNNENADVSYFMDGQILLVKNRIMKLSLPSLGLTLVAKLPEEELNKVGLVGNNKSFGNKELLLPS